MEPFEKCNLPRHIIYLSQTKYSRNSLENIVLCDASLKYFYFFLDHSISLIQSNESDACVTRYEANECLRESFSRKRKTTHLLTPKESRKRK